MATPNTPQGHLGMVKAHIVRLESCAAALAHYAENGVQSFSDEADQQAKMASAGHALACIRDELAALHPDEDADAAVDDDVPCDLLYIAKHVITWPCWRVDWVRLDRDGEICFGGDTTEHDFFPEGKHDEHPAFLPHLRVGSTATGRRYTREEWDSAQ